MVLKLPQVIRQKILHLLNSLSALENCTIRQWASFVGFVSSCCVAVQYGRLYTKNSKLIKSSALQKNGGDFEARMNLPSSLREDYEWWKDNISEATNPIRQQKFVREIFSDASMTYWGAAWDENRARGFWKEYEKEFHINHLELIAVFMALKCFVADITDCEVLFRVYNTTALAYVNKMGSTRYPHLNQITRNNWKWSEKR